jgi:glycosyltransferase involved in cell wall biosynthesis
MQRGASKSVNTKKEPMKVLLISDTFVPKIDGIVTTVSQTIKQLCKSGHEVMIIAPYGGFETYECARVIGMKGKPFRLYPELTLCYPRASMRKVIQDFDPDVVHVVEPALLGIAGLYYAGGRTGGALGLPLVTSYHTDLPKYINHFKLGFMAPVVWSIMRARHNRGTINLCTSHAMMTELAEHGIERLRLWPGGVDVDVFQPEKRSAEMRARLSGGHPNAPLLIYVGRLSAEKEIERLKPILEAIPGARLAIVGDGPVHKHLEEVFSGMPVYFAGFLRGEELAAAFASSDVMVMTSRTETLGLVVLEAMCSGVPVVGANAGGIPEMIHDGVDGFLFDNEAEAITAIRSLLDSPDERRQFGERARASALEHGWLAATELLVGFYKEAIENQCIVRPEDRAPLKFREKWRPKAMLNRSILATLRFFFR